MCAHYLEHYWIYMPPNNFFGIRIQLYIQKDKWNLWERHQNNKGPLLENCYLPTWGWGQVDLHTPDLRLTAYPPYAFSMWESMKNSYMRKIGLHCIHTYQSHHHILYVGKNYSKDKLLSSGSIHIFVSGECLRNGRTLQ